MQIKLPPIKLYPTIRHTVLIIISLVGAYKGIVQSRQYENKYIEEKKEKVGLMIELDSVKTTLWAKEILVKNLSERIIACHDEFNSFPYELWYKKMEIDEEGNNKFLMMYVNPAYANNILGGRNSAASYISKTDYFAHPSYIAFEYWKADELVVKYWKKIRFEERVRMSDGSIKRAIVEKWPERRGNDVYVFGIIIRYID